MLCSVSSYFRFPWSNLTSPSSTLLHPSSVKRMGYLTQKVLKIAWFPTKCPTCSFFQVRDWCCACPFNTSWHCCPYTISSQIYFLSTQCMSLFSPCLSPSQKLCILHYLSGIYPWQDRKMNPICSYRRSLLKKVQLAGLGGQTRFWHDALILHLPSLVYTYKIFLLFVL